MYHTPTYRNPIPGYTVVDDNMGGLGGPSGGPWLFIPPIILTHPHHTLIIDYYVISRMCLAGIEAGHITHSQLQGDRVFLAVLVLLLIQIQCHGLTPVALPLPGLQLQCSSRTDSW